MSFVIEICDPFPPHGVEFEFIPGEGTGYGFEMNAANSANFYIGRGDPIIERMANLMPGRKRVGPFVRMRRDDGLFPWAGWITDYKASPGALYYRYVAKDHGYLLGRHRTAMSGTYTGSVGRVLIDVLSELGGRAILPFSLERISSGGPYIDFTPNAKSAGDVLNQLAKHANYEWWWDIEATVNRTKVYLRFESRRGRDRRSEVLWEEGMQLNVGDYSQSADGKAAEVLVVGGTGTFADRPAVSVNVKGTNSGASGRSLSARAPLVGEGSPIFGGSNVIINRSVSAVEALAAAGYSHGDTPEDYGEQLSGTLIEGNTNMKLWAVGDIITARLSTTDLGAPTELPVRIMGVQFDPDDLEHSLEMQVLQGLIA